MTAFGDSHQKVVEDCLKDMRRIAINLEENDERTSDQIREAMKILRDTESQRVDAKIAYNRIKYKDEDLD